MPTASKVEEKKVRPQKDYISWERFQEEYLVREDGYKYEWLNGEVAKTPYAMNAKQLYILDNILNFFMKLKFTEKIGGQLLPESDLFFHENHRRPDICWLTNEQILALAKGEKEIPAFIIEIISNHDVMNRVVEKMNDYRTAGVKVVWHILPEHQEVHVYTGEKLENMHVHTLQDNCSAQPAMPEFELSVEDIFKK